MLQKFTGIVLRAKDYGESNQIIHVFSDTKGKISMIARGSKKPKSRFSAITEPFTEGQFICYIGSGMATLSQGDILNAHRSISADLMKTAFAAYWFELVDRLIPEKEPNPALFQLLSELLTQLENGKHPEVLTRIFELRMMAVAGYKPVLDHCVNCRSTSQPFRLSVIQGGFLCTNCFGLDHQARQLSKATTRILPILQKIDIKRLGNIGIKADTEKQLEMVINAFIQEYLGVEFKTKAIIKRLQD